METVYFNQPYLQLQYNQEDSLVKAIWSGFLSSAEIQTGGLVCLRLLDEHKPAYWLADNRKMKAIRQHDQDWILAVLWPQLVNSSIQKMATLVSEDIFNQMAIENLFSRAGDQVKFEHQYFKSEEAAQTWLIQDLSQNKTMKMA